MWVLLSWCFCWNCQKWWEAGSTVVRSGGQKQDKQATECLWWLCPSCCFQATDEDEETEEVDQDQCFPLFSKPKAQGHDFSCNHQEESSDSSESSDSTIRSNVTSTSSANTSKKQAVLGAQSRKSVGGKTAPALFQIRSSSFYIVS